MIYQLHHQYPDKKTEFVAQSEDIPTNSNDITRKDYCKKVGVWKMGVLDRHPLPEGCNWFMCNEKAKEFMRAAPQKDVAATTG